MIDRYRDGVVPTPSVDARRLPAEFEGLAEAVRERLDGIELTAALDEIWRRIKRLNRYVQEEQPWQLAKDEAQAERLDAGPLHGWPRACAWSPCCCTRSCRSSAERLLAALGREDLSLELAALRGRAAAARRSASSASSSRGSRPKRRRLDLRRAGVAAAASAP